MLIAAEYVEVIEPSDAKTMATCLFDSACLSVCLVVNVAVTNTQRSVVLWYASFVLAISLSTFAQSRLQATSARSHSHSIPFSVFSITQHNGCQGGF